MPDQHDASVVIPVGSCDDLLRAQLDALAKQDYEGDWEIVLACNMSDPDRIAALNELATRYDKVRVVDASTVRSAAYARNEGARAATGEILAFCDGDDIADPSWLANIAAATKPTVVAGGHLEEELLSVTGQENWRPPATPGKLPEFLDHPYLISANMAIHRDLFVEVGGFDLSLIRGEDIAFGFALLKVGATLVYVEDAVVHYRHRAGLRPMLSQHYLYGRGMAQVLRRHALPDGSSPSALRPNSALVPTWSMPQFLRRAALGLGRVHGATIDRVLEKSAT